MRVGGLRARLVWQNAARGAFAAPAVERRVLCVAGQRGGGVGAHAWRINTCRWTSGFFSLSKDKGRARNGGRHRTFRTDPTPRARYLSHSINRRLRGRSAIAPHYPPDTMCLTGTWRMGIRTSTPPNDARRW